MILGSDVFEEVVLDGKFTEENGTHFRNTVFGWIASGKHPESQPTHSQITSSVCINNTFDLRKFWELEEISPLKTQTAEEIACEQHFQDTTRVENNRFVVQMPFKADVKPLGDTYLQAKRRFLSLEKRLLSDPQLKEGYCNFINEFAELKHTEQVPIDDIHKPNGEINFLLHHCVQKAEPTTTKLRVVFDGSAKSDNGTSLNSSLMVVPTIQQDLFSLLVRFRLHRVALTADIAKMYRQIVLDTSARDFHRFLWREDPNQPIQQFRMTRVIYGITSAAYHSVRSLVEVSNRCSNTDIALTMKNDFYVDDYLSGMDSIEAAKERIGFLCQELSNFGFELRKWASSHSELISSLPEKLRESSEAKFMDQDYKIKTLGLAWKPNADHFQFFSNFHNSGSITTRQLLSDTAKLFDPVGWFGPIVIKFKILLQKLWTRGVDWDEKLPQDLLEEWIAIKVDLHHLHDFYLPRCILPPNTVESIQFHLFTDASELAYAAVLYARFVDSMGFVVVNVVAGKNRVAPIKTVSLPRLELCAAHLGTKLLTKIRDIFQLTSYTNVETTAWTDSTIVLQWLAQLPRTWTTFVANRVSEIQQVLPKSQWRHVTSASNPADCSSRGTTMESLKQSRLWWHGPLWLSKPENEWPQMNPLAVKATEEKRQSKTDKITRSNHKITSAIGIQKPPLFDCSRYSSFTKFCRVVATVKMAIETFMKQSKSKHIKAHDLIQAKLEIVRQHQEDSFRNEINILRQASELPRNNNLLNLSPFFDEETKTLRVGGRLSQGTFRESKKFPFLVEKDSQLAFLILQHFHEATLHGGGQLTLNSSREEFWIPNGRNLARKVIKQCVTCSRFENKVPNQLMADLPAERITASKPFQTCGLDLAGPIYTKSNQKTYIAIFVCFVIKAVHIELVEDLTKEACISAIRRFISRRGLPKKIVSDNGRNFIGARNDMIKVQQLLAKEPNDRSVGNFMAHQGIEWETIPPRSPHFGGLWEAAVKSMKRHLRRIVGLRILSYEELNTLVIQIESILNSRPLSAISNDPNDLQPIKPAHFLLGRPAFDLPSTDISNKSISLPQRFKLLERIKNDFWKAWYRDYLVTLQIRKRWLVSGPSFAEGDLVLIAEDNLPPLRWQMARIEKLYSGNDNISRVAKVKTSSGTFNRPIVKLRKLPIDTPVPASVSVQTTMSTSTSRSEIE